MYTLALKLQARCGALVAVQSADSQDHQVLKSRPDSWDEVSYDQGTIAGDGTPPRVCLEQVIVPNDLATILWPFLTLAGNPEQRRQILPKFGNLFAIRHFIVGPEFC